MQIVLGRRIKLLGWHSRLVSLAELRLLKSHLLRGRSLDGLILIPHGCYRGRIC